VPHRHALKTNRTLAQPQQKAALIPGFAEIWGNIFSGGILRFRETRVRTRA
jgi:hypothetical protein